MQESVIYQELREEARQEVRQELLDEGRREEARSLVLRLLTRRVGQLPDPVRSHIESLAIAQLEALSEALLDFSNLFDLEAWLMDQG